jgi:hypothetical protein
VIERVVHPALLIERTSDDVRHETPPPGADTVDDRW